MTTLSQLETVRGEIAEIKTKIQKTEEALAVAQESADTAFLRQRLNNLDKKENLLLEQQNRLQGQASGLAENAFQQLNSNVEIQTQAVLRLANKFDSVASLLRFAKAAEFVYTPSIASSLQDPNFKLQLIKAYQPSSYDEARNKPYQTCKCMVLDVSLPTGYVTASHLFKFKWHMRVKEVLGFDNINNSRNGLLLAKPVEEAFDAGYLCFIPDQDGRHRLHLLDSRLSDVKLTDMKQYPWLKPLSQDKMSKEGKQQDLVKDAVQALNESFGDIPTFATLQGKQLHFEGDERPFKRCLAFQASQSRHSALSQGRISPLDVPEISGSAWSDSSYLDRVKDYLSAPYFQFPSGPMDSLDNISEEE